MKTLTIFLLLSFGASAAQKQYTIEWHELLNDNGRSVAGYLASHGWKLDKDGRWSHRTHGKRLTANAAWEKQSNIHEEEIHVKE